MKKTTAIFSKISLSLVCGVLLFTGCFKEDKNAQATQQNMVIPVSTYRIKTANVPVSFEFPAKLESLQSVDIYARVEGTLLEQHFVEGGLVKEGDKLFKIDPSKYQASFNMARAQLLSSQATFRAASRDWKRAQKLFKENALSPKEYDSAQSAYESANAAVANARANLDIAKINLDYTDVMATASGKISMKRYDIGDLVGAAGGNNVLTTITQLDPIYAEFSIPSNDYYFVRTLNQENVSVHYILPDGNKYEKEGKIDFLDSVIDPSTATIKARALVENPEHLLVPGEFSRIKLEGFVLENSIIIPQNALLQDSKGSYVFKIVDGKAQPAYIITGHIIGNSVVVKSGLSNNDVIITSQLIKLRSGAPVAPMQQNGQ
ncbi:efflux RND transporter periplasmic adaptor subunit [Helicobacter turcicus]|uniref:Efflux RND transporter periplasmic adaptor subunit n=1 Tax=Helicobacter turcicus TaxID=2867412 RepID=A0ABS7JLV1_9HELI|nr:efflux RND transporter periplasmic adaptor subunit [Helicobacter turcicus]MBX7490372.1 efflux RND transporter periplasmic adaptor subunit [Helicobacter turcicus]MBX7545049.1 efflux RND transporter periplasmic adaptor subunit [Helicobacter turcicus]